MTSLCLVLPFPPSVNSYWRHVVMGRRSATILSAKAREYRHQVAKEVTVQHVQGMQVNGRLAVHIEACPPDRRARDLDNLHKAILDSIRHAGVIRDDSDIDDLRIVRGEVMKLGCIKIRISEIAEGCNPAYNVK